MGFLPALTVLLAVTVSGVRSSPWNQLDKYLHLARDVDTSSSLSSTNSSDVVVSVSIPTSTSSSTSTNPSVFLPSDASTSTISQWDNDCSGTVTYTGNGPFVGTVTITETVTVDPSVDLLPPTFVTPIQPCETELVTLTQAPCDSPCVTVPLFTPMASSVIQITKKTTVHERPVMTDPPLFDEVTEPEPEPQHSVTNPPVSDIDVEQVISDILSDIHAPPDGPGPEPTPTDQLPPSPPSLSTITSPPEATDAVTVAGIPITVADQSIIVIGTHSITFTHKPSNTNANAPIDGVLGPTTTITVSGQLITVAPPVLIAPGTTFVVNPSLLTSDLSPSPTAGSVSASGNDESSGNAGQTETTTTTTTSSSAGSLNRAPGIIFNIIGARMLIITATIMMIMVSV